MALESPLALLEETIAEDRRAAALAKANAKEETAAAPTLKKPAAFKPIAPAKAMKKPKAHTAKKPAASGAVSLHMAGLPRGWRCFTRPPRPDRYYVDPSGEQYRTWGEVETIVGKTLKKGCKK